MSVVALHAQESGSATGTPLLLGASLGTTVEMWAPALPALERNHRIIRFDHRGHGASPLAPAPWDIADLGGDTLALLDRLGLERVSYAGVSLGGMVGMWLAANAPERIERLVVICSSAHLPPAEVWAQRAAAVRAAGSVGAVVPAVLERWFTAPFRQSHPEVMTWVEQMLCDCPPEGYAGCCGVIERLDLRGELGRIAAPTLVIAAAEDPATPPEHSQAIADAVAGARLQILAHGAHLSVIERTGEVTEAIDRHLAVAA
jgi:3-oxoadipate enol-lactonase